MIAIKLFFNQQQENPCYLHGIDAMGELTFSHLEKDAFDFRDKKTANEALNKFFAEKKIPRGWMEINITGE